jgi:hypothetical protein
VQKFRIVHDPKIPYDLLRFCQHTRLEFLAQNILGAEIGDLTLFKDLALFLSRFSYKTQLYSPFFIGAW